tara:strand:+ start:1840 stop:2241 length:402 start_codon:yes stop_codon:yes gene_type:complete
VRGVRINFQGDKIKLDYQHPLEQKIDCLAQNAVVNTAQPLNSDAIYPDKGTTLVQQVFSGQTFNEATANHAGNFAAVQSRNFVNAQLEPNTEEKLASYVLEVDGVTDDNRGWKYNARVRSTLGVESTVTWTIK